MADCLIALGANLGDRRQTLDRAIEKLSRLPDTRLLARSSWHGTTPVGGPAGQGDFLNGALRLETALSPEALRAALAGIEADLGRVREVRWGARAIDLDLLLYDELELETPALIVPHPRMAFRRFGLAPAAEIAPDMLHPSTSWTIAKLLEHLDAPPYFAIAGLPEREKAELAKKLAIRIHAVCLDSPASPAVDAAAGQKLSGPHSGQSIQFLHKWKDRMRQVEAAAGQPCVSGFWFDECLAHAKVLLPDEQFVPFKHQWLAEREQVPAPKLLMVLPGASDPVQSEIRRLAKRRGIGPVLRLTSTSMQENIAEATAAIEAMR